MLESSPYDCINIQPLSVVHCLEWRRKVSGRAGMLSRNGRMPTRRERGLARDGTALASVRRSSGLGATATCGRLGLGGRTGSVPPL
jgi:hypothetical protein